MLNRYLAIGPRMSEITGIDLTGMFPGATDEHTVLYNDDGEQRRAEIAARYPGAEPADVEIEEQSANIRRRVADRIDPRVLDVALVPSPDAVWWVVQRWRADPGDGHYAPAIPADEIDSYGQTYHSPVSFVLDDPTFGPPVDLADLAYSPDVGLYRKEE